jgi:hypothetical protein
MGLTKAQQILITKARNPGGSELGIFLDELRRVFIAAGGETYNGKCCFE